MGDGPRGAVSSPDRTAGVRSLHLCHTRDRRGAEVFGWSLAEGLSRVGMPASVRAIRPGDLPNPLPIEAVGQRGRTPLAIARLHLLARRHDVVVGHGSATMLAGTAATLGTRTPFVYRLIGDPRFWSDVRLRGLRTSGPLRRAAGVVAMWSHARTSLIELHRLRPERVHVIPNGRDADDYVPPTSAERADARAALGLEAGEPTVGYVGALSWEKQPLLAIRAVEAVPGATLVIAGDGPMRDAVADAARRSRSRVVLLGHVADTRAVHHAVDALLISSKTEGIPGAAIEAGLCGIPTVAPDVGGTGDLVSDDTGRLVSPDTDEDELAGALAAVLADRERLGANARAHTAQEFSLERSVGRWADLLVALAAR